MNYGGIVGGVGGVGGAGEVGGVPESEGLFFWGTGLIIG